ncbi:Metallo-dependent hydrolase [Lasiodiplodia theobromae]|uniref:adenosine deaminase n=1 Tax=Lasiodiplodia theobromae TaxID=45133 RepID=A0A5N5DB41_9PEZI|nr:Adenosine deaminase AGSA [Lasiodiplodia theobromae]KAF9637078.1 Metallo-dependent hydrolase [Lasiodiplodia theobromae]
MTEYTPPPVGHRYANKDDYLTARAALIAAEQAHSFRATLSPSTPLEARANAILHALKQQDEAELHTMHPNGTGFELGHKFLHGLSTIASSKIFAIAARAPKGALLHCHFDAILPPELLLADARRNPHMCIRTDAPLSHAGFFAAALPTFSVLPAADLAATKGVDIFSPAYVAGSWMPYARFLERFPGGAAEAERWLRAKVVLHAERAYAPEQTVDGIWALFKRSFAVLRGLVGYVTAWKAHFARVLWHLARDGVSYAEIRIPMQWQFFVKTDDASRELSRKEMVGLLKEVLDEEVPKIRAEGLVFWGARFIYGSFRLCERENMRWMMEDCIELKQEYPDLICGFDMQGQEDDGHSHLHWIQELLDFRARCDSLGLDIPFIFHAGETLQPSTSQNLYDAILLSTKRIGHGFALPQQHPYLLQLCRDRKIAIETCPISNEVLGLAPTGIRNHPLPILLATCVPCTINTDDPGCWEASMSHEWYQVMVGTGGGDGEAGGMDLKGWRKLAGWSLEYSCMPDAERKEAEREFERQWEEFCGWIVETYGAEIESGKN